MHSNHKEISTTKVAILLDNIVPVSSNGASVPGLQDLLRLQAELEEERRSKKELAKANVKLNGMLKVGQDALHAEQQAVASLQAQLTDKHKVAAQVPV